MGAAETGNTPLNAVETDYTTLDAAETGNTPLVAITQADPPRSSKNQAQKSVLAALAKGVRLRTSEVLDCLRVMAGHMQARSAVWSPW